MSPYEFDKYRNDFVVAADKFGWKKKRVEREHERDWNCSWEVNVWLDQQGRWLFDEGDVSEAMAQEIIRISKLVP